MFNEKRGKGYVGQSMSVNALESKEDYEVPLSDINKDLLEELEINETVAFMKFLMKEMGSTSYHHTGKYYNETNFYDINRYFELSEEEIENYKNDYVSFKKNEKEESKDYYYGEIFYTVWEGKYKKYRRPVDYAKTCLVIGNWAYFEDGTKKKIDGNGIKSLKNLGTTKPQGFDDKNLKKLIEK